VQYVRLRQGPTTDDLPRLQRQQDLTRAVSNSLLSTSTTRSPIRLARVLNALADHVVVDKGWDTGEMRGLALSLRNLRGRDVGYVTLPHGQFEHTPDGARYLPLDYVRCDQLFSDIRQDKVSDYLKQYPEASLPNTATIN
ncbi:MAG: LCP family protein, partial [Nocardioidaceae bacterium]